MNDGIGEHSLCSIGGLEALLEVAASRHWGVFVGAVAAGDHSIIIRLYEEGQRLTCAGVSGWRQHNSVDLRGADRRPVTPILLFYNSFDFKHLVHSFFS